MSSILPISGRRAVALVATALAGCHAGDSLPSEDGPSDYYLGDLFTDRSRIAAQVYTPNVCFVVWTPAPGCRSYSDQSHVSCAERRERDGGSAENGVESVSFQAGEIDLRTVVPEDANGFVAFDLGGDEMPDRLRVLGRAGELSVEIFAPDRPVAEARGEFAAVFDPTDTSTTLQASWEAASAADLACVATFSTDGNLSRRCCDEDLGQLELWTDGAVDRVWLERFNYLGLAQDGSNALAQWQHQSTQLAPVESPAE